MANRDPRDIYYQCTGCGRTSISFHKPFPELCGECQVAKLLTDGPESGPPLTAEEIDEMDQWLKHIIESVKP